VYWPGGAPKQWVVGPEPVAGPSPKTSIPGGIPAPSPSGQSPRAADTTAWASSWIRARCSGPRKLSA
jgi:hypothetical protein